MYKSIIKGIEVREQSKNILINNLLLNKYNYNSICKCGTEQTYANISEKLKQGHIDKDFTCKPCRDSREVFVFGNWYPRISIAVENEYKNQKCSLCNRMINKTSFYNQIKHGKLQNINNKIICDTCIRSNIRKDLNKTKPNIKYKNFLFKFYDNKFI